MNTAPKVQVRRLKQQSEKYKNERHRTYATFLFRDVRQVSHLTGKSNVTKKVHESGKTSCTAQKKKATGLRNHASVKQQTRSESSRHGMYHTTVTKSRYTVVNSPQTSMIPMTQGWCTCNAFAWNATGRHVVQLMPQLHAHNSSRCQYKSHIRKSKYRQSNGHSCNASIQPTHIH